jgi:hypothetical protein
MASEVLRHQERYGTQPAPQQLEILKAGVQYQEQRMSVFPYELKGSMAHGLNRNPNQARHGTHQCCLRIPSPAASLKLISAMLFNGNAPQ